MAALALLRHSNYTATRLQKEFFEYEIELRHQLNKLSTNPTCLAGGNVKSEFGIMLSEIVE